MVCAFGWAKKVRQAGGKKKTGKGGKREAGLGLSDVAEIQAWGGEKERDEARERVFPLELRFCFVLFFLRGKKGFFAFSPR